MRRGVQVDLGLAFEEPADDFHVGTAVRHHAGRLEGERGYWPLVTTGQESGLEGLVSDVLALPDARAGDEETELLTGLLALPEGPLGAHAQVDLFHVRVVARVELQVLLARHDDQVEAVHVLAVRLGQALGLPHRRDHRVLVLEPAPHVGGLADPGSHFARRGRFFVEPEERQGGVDLHALGAQGFLQAHAVAAVAEGVVADPSQVHPHIHCSRSMRRSRWAR